MKTLMTLAGVAALAIAAPSLADPGGKGGGKGGGGQGGGKPAKVERGGGGGGGGQAKKADRADRGQASRPQRMERRADRSRRVERQGRPERREMKADRGNQGKVRVAREDRRPEKVERRQAQRRDVERQQVRIRDERRDDNVRVVRDERYSSPQVRYASDRFEGYERGNCPPGLAAKNNGCLPPGQAKKLVGQRLPDRYRDDLLPAYYRTWYPDSDRYTYRSGDGYIYRIDRTSGLVGGLMPFFDWSDQDVDYYYPGEPYPLDTYSFYNVPAAYQPYYYDNDDYYYRYGDGAIYEIDRGDGLVEGIVALLAGDLGMGQQLPLGYDAYNVPLAYRDRYYDTPDAWYRYNDGYIYQVDPKTRLIQAVIQALV